MRSQPHRVSMFAGSLLSVFMLVSCSSGGGEDKTNNNPQKFTVGGTLSGLTGTVVLQNNGTDNLTRTADGAFTFAIGLVNGVAYNVTVSSQPTGQTCTVSNSSGTMSTANITNIMVSCANSITYSLGGSITGAANSAVDSDVNDPNAPYASNGPEIADAQPLGNPVVVGGFASAVGTGVAGDRFADAFDETDLFSVKVAAGQSINLYMGTDPLVADLDLGLYDSTGATLLASSTGTGNTESITVATAGSYIVQVFADAGISTYTLSIGIAPLSATVHDLNTSAEFVPGEVIVRFKDSLLPAGAYADSPHARAAAIGMQVKAGSPRRAMLFSLGNGGTRTQALSALGITPRAMKNLVAKADPVLKDKLETLLAVKALRARADVASADLNYIRRAQLTPNDNAYSYQWHYPLINLPQAWDVTTGSANVVVAVIDTGVLMTHPDLAPNLTTTGYDFISNAASALDGNGIDSNPDDPGDASVVGQSSWHGTHVAGTVAAASNNSIGVAGVAWLSKIMPLRVLGKGGGTDYDIIQAVRYAAGLTNDSGTVPAQKADIINLSLGGPGSSQVTQDTYTAARNAGVIIIAAAGNDNVSSLFYPASYDGVVSVSAVDMNKVKAPYSNFGTKIDLAAPGGNTGVDLNNDGVSDGVVSTLVDDSSGTRVASLKEYQGTSMASPHVAGVAALMVSVRKTAGSTLTPAEFDAFISNGSIVNDIGAAGRDDLYGYGLIDAFKAVQAASAVNVTPTALDVNPMTLNFGTLADGSANSTLTVSKIGAGNLSVATVTTSASWLTVTEATVDGSKLGTYTATATKGVLPDGLYSGAITFTANTGVTVKVSVSMRIGAPMASNANVGHLYVLLLNAATFDTLDTVEVAASGGTYAYSFSGVAPGTYYIAAGSDMNNDGFVCEEGEACGVFPTLESIGQITVNGNLTGIDFNAGYISSIGTNAANSGAQSVLKFSRRTQKQAAIR